MFGSSPIRMPPLEDVIRDNFWYHLVHDVVKAIVPLPCQWRREDIVALAVLKAGTARAAINSPLNALCRWAPETPWSSLKGQKNESFSFQNI